MELCCEFPPFDSGWWGFLLEPLRGSTPVLGLCCGNCGKRGSAVGDVILPEGGGREVEGAADDDAGVFCVCVEVVGDGAVDDGHAAF